MLQDDHIHSKCKTSTDCFCAVFGVNLTTGVAGREIVSTVRAADWSEYRRITRTVFATFHRRIQSPDRAERIQITRQTTAQIYRT